MSKKMCKIPENKHITSIREVERNKLQDKMLGISKP